MRKVPPILKPIALLTLSILIATTSGILNNSSYRQGKATTPTTESTTRTTDSSHDSNSMISETSTVEVQTPNEESNVNNGVQESSVANNSIENTQPSTTSDSATVQQSSTEESQTASTQQQQQPANEPAGSEAGDNQ